MDKIKDKIVEEFNGKFQQIKSDLESVKDSVLSEEKRKEKIEEIKKRAEETREDLENEMNSLKDTAREKAQTLLDSLNQIINFKNTIWDNNTSAGTTQSSPSEGKNIFVSIKDRVREQRDNLKNPDKRKAEPWKTTLRFAWFVSAGLWLLGSAIWWVKSLWKKAFTWDKKGEKKQSQEKSEEAKPDEKEKPEENEKKPFWKRWYWKAIKYSVIPVYFLVHWIKTGRWNLKDSFNRKDNDTEKLIEEKLWKLNWFEKESKNLRDRANNCHQSHRYLVDAEKNKEEYDGILDSAVKLRDESKTIFDEIQALDVSDEVKQQSERIKNSIDKYVQDIEDMKEEIYKTVKWVDNRNEKKLWDWGQVEN